MNINSVLNIIKNKTFNKFKEFNLDKKYFIDNDQKSFISLLKDFDFNKNSKFFISKTFSFDYINVIDINNVKYITFENNIDEYTNKGINNNIEINIY